MLAYSFQCLPNKYSTRTWGDITHPQRFFVFLLDCFWKVCKRRSLCRIKNSCVRAYNYFIQIAVHNFRRFSESRPRATLTLHNIPGSKSFFCVTVVIICISKIGIFCTDYKSCSASTVIALHNHIDVRYVKKFRHHIPSALSRL